MPKIVEKSELSKSKKEKGLSQPNPDKSPLPESTGDKPDSKTGKEKSQSPSGKEGNQKPLKILYPRYECHIFTADSKKAPLGPDGKPVTKVLSGAVAKEMLIWEEEIPKVKEFKDNYLLKDKNGKKIRCLANTGNRPYYESLANDWMLEILRRKWKFNGEPIIIDETGMDQDGQHRLIGLILAIQEWELDKKRPKDEQKWQGFWKTEPYIETLVVLGIKADDETINTMNTGRKRSEADALYRCDRLKGKPDKVRQTLAKIIAFAVKLLKDRSRQDLSSLVGTKWPHSQMFEFLERHPRVFQAAEFIYETAEGNTLAELVPLGTATALLYMMGCSDSDVEKGYAISNNESDLDWSQWERARDFWVDVADNGKATEPLREHLNNVPLELRGGIVRDLRIGYCVKAWNIYPKKLTLDNVRLELGSNDQGVPVLTEHPRIGGIDIEYEEDYSADPEDDSDSELEGVDTHVDTDVAHPDKDCIKGGKHEFVTEDGETYCTKCLGPKAGVTKAKK